MIASENFVSEAVLEAAGSIFTNKYAEGYPDAVITAAASTPMWSRILPRSRAPDFWRRSCECAASLRFASQRCGIRAVLQPGDTILGLDLAHGGTSRTASPQLQRQALSHHLLSRSPRHRANRLRRNGSDCASRKAKVSSAAAAPIRACGTLNACARSQTKLALLHL